jgi:hypothetical protein
MIRCVRECHPTRRKGADLRRQAAPGPAPRRLKGAVPMDPSLIYTQSGVLDGTRIRRTVTPSPRAVVRSR